MRTHRITAVVVLTLCVAAPLASGQLINPGFEGPNNVVPISDIVSPALAPGYWGVETAYVTGPSYTSPPEGSQMLEMYSAGLMYTEAWQFVDVGAGTGRTANLSAWFNAFLPNTIGLVDLLFYANDTTGGWGNQISNTPMVVTLTLGNENNAWEQISESNVAVPDATTWVGVHLGFNSASLGTERGDIDAVEFTITPEPCTFSLLALAALAVIRRRRQRG
jgi:hypothetical protein